MALTWTEARDFLRSSDISRPPEVADALEQGGGSCVMPRLTGRRWEGTRRAAECRAFLAWRRGVELVEGQNVEARDGKLKNALHYGKWGCDMLSCLNV